MSKKIAVVGANGFLGSPIVEAFCASVQYTSADAFADLYYPFSIRDLHPESTDSPTILFLALWGA